MQQEKMCGWVLRFEHLKSAYLHFRGRDGHADCRTPIEARRSFFFTSCSRFHHTVSWTFMQL